MPNSTTPRNVCPACQRWLWQSLMPGMALRPFRSISFVQGAARPRISSLSPVATISLPQTAKALQMLSVSSAVKMLPL